MFDWIIKGGTVVAGDGSPARLADIAISDGTISAVGNDLADAPARNVLQAEGRHVLPGFVDIHSHCDLYPIAQPHAEAMVHQGITTAIAGNCSLSVAPVASGDKAVWKEMYGSLWGSNALEWNWNSMVQFLDAAQASRPSVNLGMLAGLGAIRLSLGGRDAAPVDPTALYDAAVEAIKQGAYGISLGQHYTPASYASADEILAVARAAADCGALLTTHMQSYGDSLEASIEETLQLGRETGVSLQISHLYAAGIRNWPKMGKVLETIEKAREEGIDVHFDRHPYDAGASSILTLLPSWVQEGGTSQLLSRLGSSDIRDRIRTNIAEGIAHWDCFASLAGWDRIRVYEIPGRGDLLVSELAEQDGTDAVDALCNLILEHGTTLPVVIHHMSEQGIIDVLTHPLGMVGSDSMYSSRPHPRTYGTYARWFGKYVRDEGHLSLEEAVDKVAGLPCRKFGLKDRGVLAVGMKADIVVLDYANVKEHSTYENPIAPPTGIDDVFVNGQPVKLGGKLSESRSGAVLRFS